MYLKNLLQSKFIIFGIAFLMLALTTINAPAQSQRTPIFDAPWRGFDAGIFPGGVCVPGSVAVGVLDGELRQQARGRGSSLEDIFLDLVADPQPAAHPVGSDLAA